MHLNGTVDYEAYKISLDEWTKYQFNIKESMQLAQNKCLKWPWRTIEYPREPFRQDENLTICQIKRVNMCLQIYTLGVSGIDNITNSIELALTGKVYLTGLPVQFNFTGKPECVYCKTMLVSTMFRQPRKYEFCFFSSCVTVVLANVSCEMITRRDSVEICCWEYGIESFYRVTAACMFSTHLVWCHSAGSLGLSR